MLSKLLADLTSGDDARALGAVKNISQMGEEAIPGLAELLNTPQPDVRWWAIYALSEIEHPEVIPYLRRGLNDENLSVRESSALGLSLHPDPALIPDLVNALNSEALLQTRLAANALIAIGKEAVPALLEIMENGPQPSRVEATRALAEIKDPRCIAAFFNAIQTGDSPMVEYWADRGLEQLGIGMSFFSPSS